ncbi:MAG: acetyl-CoA carboxylase biotin carboxylase subunit [Bacillota bacterium]
MFKKVLVANRGEIAVRIIRVCRDLGLKTVAVYSEADRESLHPAMADEKVCLPGFKPADTYLNMEKILQAAGETGAGAVHPGYGYLAENQRFAAGCREAGLVFIGPRPENIALVGNKLAAKEKAMEAGVPVIPGSRRGITSLGEGLAVAAEIGFPVIVKASAGGGGRGMRICLAGTVEFIPDGKKNFYFMEINSRLQVEHPVTEMVTGIDIVKEQIRLSLGDTLRCDYSSVPKRGWAIECRINAEDPDNSFLSSPGEIERYRPPGGFGVRLDTHVYQGYRVPPYYDSLLAKLIAYGPDRESAVKIMLRALEEFVIEPVKTTIPLHKKVLAHPLFREGNFDTGFIKLFVSDQENED